MKTYVSIYVWGSPSHLHSTIIWAGSLHMLTKGLKIEGPQNVFGD